MFFSQLFCLKLPVKITMGKAIGRIYKHDQRNWSYPSTKTTFVIPSRFDTSIPTQRNSASDVSSGANYVTPSGLDQSTNHHVIMDGKYNDDSQSYDKPQKYSVSHLLVIQYPPQPHKNLPHCLHLEKGE